MQAIQTAEECDLGWLGLTGQDGWLADAYWGFGSYPTLRAPERLDVSGATAYYEESGWLEPCVSYRSMNRFPGVPAAYIAARSARFEHGESGAF